MRRKYITKKTRFEVFKRDSFTCQYCGRQAPDIVLNLDHIKPVAKGGDNEVINLITSCFDCNSGKKHRELNDDTVVKKQMTQLNELNEKRNQLELICKWRDEIKNINSDKVEIIKKAILSHTPNCGLHNHWDSKILLWIKKYELQVIFDAIDMSAERYIINGTQEEFINYSTKINGVLCNMALPLTEQKVNHISGYASKVFEVKFWKCKERMLEIHSALKKSFFSDEEIIDLFNDMFDTIKTSRNYKEFMNQTIYKVNNLLQN